MAIFNKKRLSMTFVGIVIVSASLILLNRVPACAQQNEDVQMLQRTSRAFSAVAKNAIPAVVFVKVEKTVETSGNIGSFNPSDPFSPFGDDLFERFFRERRPNFRQPRKLPSQVSQGSGFIISKDGYILTNNHVVDKADKVIVKLKDGREFQAKTVGMDPQTDVAVIKIDAKDLPVLPLGNSDDLEIGEWVIAIGNPFGLTETVTVGVVSAKGRSGVGIADYEDFIQTDAAINPGNSGGPLINLRGEAVGMNTAIFSQGGGYRGIGFAIPANMIKSVKEQLIKEGKVTRGYLGIYINNVTVDLAKFFGLEEGEGVVIAEVQKDSPAEKAGLQQDDIILKLNGRKVKHVSSFRNSVAQTAPDTEIELLVYRDKKEMEIKIKIGSLAESPTAQAPSDVGERIGLQVQNLTEELARQFGYSKGEGVLISNVEPGSIAQRAGLDEGALIVSVNRKKVTSVIEFNAAMKESEKTKRLLLLVKQGQWTRYVVLSLD